MDMDEEEIKQVKEQWMGQQCELRKKLITDDAEDWQKCAEFDQVKFVGGVDISFVKDDEKHACAALVVLSFPELKVVYEEYEFVHLTAPYIPEFLAFREVSFLEKLICKLKESKPEYIPEVIFVDGNGVLHPRGFGLASHLGVITDMCTAGIGKTLFQVDGLEKNAEHLKKINQLKEAGDFFLLVGDSGSTLGAALRSTDSSKNPIYVSVGNRISLETSLKLTQLCCRHRIPEPVRQADIRSREFLRLRYEDSLQSCGCFESQNGAKKDREELELVDESIWTWCSLL